MNLSDIIEKFWLGLVGLLVTGIGVLVRRVFTNEKQIAVLLASQEKRDEDLKEIKQDVKELIRKVG